MPESNFSNRRLQDAYDIARSRLMEMREPQGHWVGELSTSALSTATAVSALAIIGGTRNGWAGLILGGVQWLATHQNADGGWGDTDKSYSNIATTMLAVSALHLADVAEEHQELIERANAYIDANGRIDGLRKRYGKDKTFAVPILTNCALAGLVPWSDVSPLPFELACFPQKMYRFLRLPVVSYAIPALVAIGQARYFHKKPLNPLARIIRGMSVKKSLTVLQRMQPASGGYLEAVPLTSFVVMSLASIGRAEHPVSKLGLDFIVNSVRPDGSWPIDSNLATWNTTLAINALADAGEDVAKLGCLDWLLACQLQQSHPFTGADPGGWGWSDLSGAVPDADDTPGAMLALANWRESANCTEQQRGRIDQSLVAGLDWLLSLQNTDGGWPTFGRGWGKLPFDRSGSDLTAHALRAINRFSAVSDGEPAKTDGARGTLATAVKRGFKYLERHQHPDGSWAPLWFGNQDHEGEENPVYGTAKVLLAYRDLDRIGTEPARRGLEFLIRTQNKDFGWGGGPDGSSVEETALAVEALLSNVDNESLQPNINKGLDWLTHAVETNRFHQPSPIGFYFARLWYYEALYPITFTVSALGQALRNKVPWPERESTPAHPA